MCEALISLNKPKEKRKQMQIKKNWSTRKTMTLPLIANGQQRLVPKQEVKRSLMVLNLLLVPLQNTRALDYSPLKFPGRATQIALVPGLSFLSKSGNILIPPKGKDGISISILLLGDWSGGPQMYH